MDYLTVPFNIYHRKYCDVGSPLYAFNYFTQTHRKREVDAYIDT